MTPTLRRKLEALAERREELERLLSDPGVIADATRFRALSREFAQLEPVATALAEERQAQQDLAAAEALRGDPEMRELAEEEIALAQQRLLQLDAELLGHLVPRDARDEGDLYLEVRAGTGGDEAAIFAGDLFRMYARYAERQGWRVEVESASPGEHGGFKEVIARIEGRGAYSRLKFESGTHRVQRVPETESQGRIHTSAATVAIIPVEPEGEPIEIHSCDDVLSHVFEFLDHETADSRRAQIAEHLEDCSSCMRQFGIEQEFKALVRRRCGGDAPPPGLKERIKLRAVYLNNLAVGIMIAGTLSTGIGFVGHLDELSIIRAASALLCVPGIVALHVLAQQSLRDLDG